MEKFVALHRPQLESIGVPSHYWTSLSTKLLNEVYDAGNFFTMLYDADTSKWKVVVTHPSGIIPSDCNSIFLIDHAWSFQLEYARKQLLAIPGLLDRMLGLMGCLSSDEDKNVEEDNVEEDNVEEEEVGFIVSDEGRHVVLSSAGYAKSEALASTDTNETEYLIDIVLDKMWRYVQSYRLRNGPVDEQATIWYIMDEFGSRVQHSDHPSFKFVPFLDNSKGMAFTLMFPLVQVNYKDEVTRDYVMGAVDSNLRTVRLLPWFYHNVIDLVPNDPLPPRTMDDLDNEGRFDEIVVDNEDMAGVVGTERKTGPFTVFTDLELVKSYVTRSEFSFTEDIDSADIIWTASHFRKFGDLEQSTNQFINQFPFESIITCKDLLARICQEGPVSDDGACRGPDWLPLSFDLVVELPQFARAFQLREKYSMDNYWIVKPWNMGRGLDIHVTNNLIKIIRLSETGPKLASRYITDPVLFYRDDVGHVKFDIRFIVLLSSVKPLVLHVYNVFWLRFANRPFCLDNLDDYETHFTVMNYADTELKQVHCHDFIPMFEQQYIDYGWADVQADLYEVIGKVFEAAASGDPPNAIIPFQQARAIYGIDMMLEWTSGQSGGKRKMAPQLLEVNYCPDCVRACKYHPDFFDDIFAFFFLGHSPEETKMTPLL